MRAGRIVKSAIMIAALLCAGPALAARVLVSGSGTWDNATVASAYTAADTDFSFSFEIDQFVPYNPVTDFAQFRYELGGNGVTGIPMDITFFSEEAGGGLQLMFAPDDLFVGWGLPMLSNAGTLTPGTSMSMNFVTNTGSAAGRMSVSSVSAVPEPATWLTMILGFGIIGLGIRRGKSQRETRLAGSLLNPSLA